MADRYGEAKDGQLYGDLAERMAKLEAKYDRGLEASLQKWIEQKTYVRARAAAAFPGCAGRLTPAATF